MAETEGRAFGSFGFKTDLFEERAIARFSKHFQNLLKALTANLDLPVNEISFISTAEAPPTALNLEPNANRIFRSSMRPPSRSRNSRETSGPHCSGL